MHSACQNHLMVLCDQIPERPVGSPGNRMACDYFKNEVLSRGWRIDEASFPALHWTSQGAEFQIERLDIPVLPSPYSLGCECKAPLTAAGSVAELEEGDFRGSLLLLHGDLTREQLMPKNFTFYNPESHQHIISLLEERQPAAILAATDRNAALAGGVYPFPLIEDGDFEIPSVYLRQEEGERILPYLGKEGSLQSRTARIPGESLQLAALKGEDLSRRYVISAHIDAKIGTPGAIDNGTGVVVLLLLAELLRNYDRDPVIELVPFNGEDYFSAPGQMQYLSRLQGKWDTVKLNINIDGAGYREGPSAVSLFNLPDDISRITRDLMERRPEIQEGKPWYQGDHSIFLQFGVPAIAASSLWFLENIESQEITHTPADHPGIVDCRKVTALAELISDLLDALTA